MTLPRGTRCLRISALQALVVLLVACLLLFVRPASSTAQYAHILLSADGHNGFVTEDGSEISPDGAYVVYRRHVGLAHYNILSVPIDGGNPVHLNTHPDDARVFGTSFQISNDSKWVIYYELVGGLRSIPISGGAPITLSPPEANTWSVTISPNSRFVAYSDRGKVYIVPISGGTPVLLWTEPAGQKDGDVRVRFSPDSSRVVIEEFENTSSGDPVRSSRLFSAQIDGTRTVELESPIDFDASTDFFITPDSQRIIAKYLSGGPPSRGPLYEIHSFPIDGGSPVRLSNQYEWSDVYSVYVDDILVHPDGSHIFYRRWDDAQKRDTIVSVPAEGGDPIELAVGEGPTQVLWPEKVTTDGDRVIYSGENYQGTALFSTPVTRSAPVELAPPHIGLAKHEVGSDGQQIVYVTEEERENDIIRSTLYSVEVTGGEPARIAQHLGTVTRMTISPESTRVLYHVVSEEDSKWYLASTSGDSVSEIQFMSREHQFSQDGTKVVYRLNDEIYALVEGTATYLPFTSGSYPSP